MFIRKRLTAWTEALRENPEQQISGILCSNSLDRFCCLGKLCAVENYVFTPNEKEGSATTSCGYSDLLPYDLGIEFGDRYGNFKHLDMPSLVVRRYDSTTGETVKHSFVSAAQANDGGATWAEIADHFDKYYPCSDEPPKRNVPSIQIDIYDRAVK